MPGVRAGAAAHARRTSRAAEAEGREIIASLSELAETLECPAEAGKDLERFTAHTVEVPDRTGRYDGRRVRATRDRIGVSQAVFAQLLGVSAVLVASCREQGSRIPGPLGPTAAGRGESRSRPLAPPGSKAS